MSATWNQHTQTKYSCSVRLYLSGSLLSLSAGWAFLAQEKKIGWFSDCSDLFSYAGNPELSKNWWKRKFIPANYASSCWCKHWNISEASSSENGWYGCFDTPVISLLGVTSCLFLRGHQLGGMSNCFDWYKMWKSCPRKPVCPCLDDCRSHKSLILISITGCRLDSHWHLSLITKGEAPSLELSNPLALLIASPQWYILSW